MGEAKRRKAAGRHPTATPNVRDNVEFIQLYRQMVLKTADIDWVNRTTEALVGESENENRSGSNLLLVGVQLISAHIRQMPVEIKEQVWMAIMAMTDHQVGLPGAEPDRMPDFANIHPEGGEA